MTDLKDLAACTVPSCRRIQRQTSSKFRGRVTSKDGLGVGPCFHSSGFQLSVEDATLPPAIKTPFPVLAVCRVAFEQEHCIDSRVTRLPCPSQ
jgi:hypothetical protein